MKALRKLLLPAMVLSLGVGLAGCVEERHAAIPASAQMVTLSSDRGAWTANEDGMIWVESVRRDKLFWTGDVKKGQMVSFNKDKNLITVDGKVMSDREIPSGSYRIWFEPKKETVIRQRTVEETHEVKVKTEKN